MKNNIKYKFLEKNSVNSLQSLEQEANEAKPQEKPFLDFESEKILIHQKINSKIHTNEERREKEGSIPVRPYKQNLYFVEQGPDFRKLEEDSLDDMFLKTLEKKDLAYLRKSMMKFNQNPHESASKYNNNGSYYPEDFEYSAGSDKDEIPEIIETKTRSDFQQTQNFSFSKKPVIYREIKTKPPGENSREIKERTLSAQIPSIKPTKPTSENQNNGIDGRKTSENQKTNLNAHASPKICKNVFSEKFANFQKKQPSFSLKTPIIEIPTNFTDQQSSDEKTKNIDKLLQKIEKLDENKRGQLSRLLDKIDEGSLELDSLLRFDFKSIAQPKIQIIEDYHSFPAFSQENLLIIRPISAWSGLNFIGLTKIELYSMKGEKISIKTEEIKLRNGIETGSLKNLFSGDFHTVEESQMWTSFLPPAPLTLEILIPFEKKIWLGGVKIWNYNKNTIEISNGVKECEIYLNGSLSWKGVIRRGIGARIELDYGEEIRVSEGFAFPEETAEELGPKANKSEIQRNRKETEQFKRKFSENSESEPVLARKKVELENLKNYDDLSSEVKKSKPDFPKFTEIPEEKLKNSRNNNDIGNLQKASFIVKSQTGKKPGGRFQNNPDYLENFNQKSGFFANETESTAKKQEKNHVNPLQEKNHVNPLDTLKFFNLHNEARLIKPSASLDPNSENPERSTHQILKSSFDEDLESLGLFPSNARLQTPEVVAANNIDFAIPKLPSGRALSISILSTWGDPYYVGLSGIEIFTKDGESVKLRSPNQIKADPPDINVLPEYGNDPRTIEKLMDGVYMTCDDLHVWLAPFSKGRANLIEIDLGEVVKVSMIRIWNYNKSRIHSFRGAKDIRISLDNRLIFQGEIKKAPGTLKNCEKFCEYIMFTSDELVLSAMEKRDWLSDELRNLPFEDEDMELILGMLERPKTATRFFREAELEEIQGMLKVNGKDSELLLGSDGRPLTLAIFPPKKTEDVPALQRKPSILSQSKRKTIKAKNLTVNLLETWGDKFYLGLTGIEIYDGDLQKLPLTIKSLSAKPRDLSSTPGFQGDPRVLENLLDSENVTTNDRKMWLIPYVKGQEHVIFLSFQRETTISGIKFWNYNKSLEDLNRGVKRISISADGSYVTPKEGVLIGKAPGNKLFDFGQFVPLPFSQSFEDEKKTLMEAKTTMNLSKKIAQVTVLKGNKNDVRTVDKLINGKNNTFEERNMWLAPLNSSWNGQKTGEKNVIYVVFSSPALISNINVWNYTKTPKRGVKELEIFLDECLIFKGVIRKAPSESEYSQGSDIVTSILFTKSNEVISTLKPIPYNPDPNEGTLTLINEKKIIQSSKIQAQEILKKDVFTERPKTGVKAYP